MTVDDEVDAIVIPSRGSRGVGVARMAMASTRLARNEPLVRQHGRKPEVAHLNDPEMEALFRKGYEGLEAGLTDGAKRHQIQDVDGLDAEFLYPGFFAMFGFKNTELLVACQKNYNDWLADYTGASSGRLQGLPAIPVQDPKAAADELERGINLGFKGGCIPCTSPADHPYFETIYEPIWTLAEEAKFPISMHVGCGAYVPASQRPQKKVDGIAGYAASQNTVQATIVELMCRGVCERHPNLKIVVAEFNAGWIAHWLYRVDQGLQRERRSMAEPYTGPRPQEIWERQFYCTIEDDRAALLTRDMVGIDTMLWGSDYPHTDSTWPCSGEVLDEMFEGISISDRNKITRMNVEKLYGL